MGQRDTIVAFFRNTDVHVRGLLVTLLVVIALVVLANIAIPNVSYSVGYCSADSVCRGVGNADFCIGERTLQQQCENPLEVNKTYKLAEVKCALQARELCQNTSFQESWAQHANFRGKSCQEWEERHANFTLVSCEQTMPAIWQYKDIQ